MGCIYFDLEKCCCLNKYVCGEKESNMVTFDDCDVCEYYEEEYDGITCEDIE